MCESWKSPHIYVFKLQINDQDTLKKSRLDKNSSFQLNGHMVLKHLYWCANDPVKQVKQKETTSPKTLIFLLFNYYKILLCDNGDNQMQRN